MAVMNFVRLSKLVWVIEKVVEHETMVMMNGMTVKSSDGLYREYWRGRGNTDTFPWTQDLKRASRFGTQEEAERMAFCLAVIHPNLLGLISVQRRKVLYQ